MFLNENNHVQWTGANEYDSLQELINWKEKFYAGIPESFKPVFDKWLKIKTVYNEAKARGEVSATITTTGLNGEKKQIEKEVLPPEIIVNPA